MTEADLSSEQDLRGELFGIYDVGDLVQGFEETTARYIHLYEEFADRRRSSDAPKNDDTEVDSKPYADSLHGRIGQVYIHDAKERVEIARVELVRGILGADDMDHITRTVVVHELFGANAGESLGENLERVAVELERIEETREKLSAGGLVIDDTNNLVGIIGEGAPLEVTLPQISEDGSLKSGSVKLAMNIILAKNDTWQSPFSRARFGGRPSWQRLDGEMDYVNTYVISPVETGYSSDSYTNLELAPKGLTLIEVVRDIHNRDDQEDQEQLLEFSVHNIDLFEDLEAEERAGIFTEEFKNGYTNRFVEYLVATTGYPLSRASESEYLSDSRRLTEGDDFMSPSEDPNSVRLFQKRTELLGITREGVEEARREKYNLGLEEGGHPEFVALPEHDRQFNIVSAKRFQHMLDLVFPETVENLRVLVKGAEL